MKFFISVVVALTLEQHFSISHPQGKRHLLPSQIPQWSWTENKSSEIMLGKVKKYEIKFD